MSKVHADLSPSGADGWMGCAQWANNPGSTTYSRYGTACHDLAARMLSGGTTAHDHLGELIEVVEEDATEVFAVDAEMIEIVHAYTLVVRDLATNHALLVESPVPIDHVTGEAGAEGTADAILLPHDSEELIVIDLKTGRGHEVDALHNKQGLMYASGALALSRMAGHDIKRVRIVISQPRVSRTPSEWVVPVEHLAEFEATAAAAAQRHGKAEATPGEAQCRWCAKKATCQALAARVQGDVGAMFDDLTATGKAADTKIADLVAQADISLALGAVDLIEDWCSAVRAEAHKRLLAGTAVTGFKLVAGKRGARDWVDAAAVEELLRKRFRLTIEQAFDLSLISPATAEKRLKDQPKRWAQLQSLISQSDGKPSVAPVSDKRPALEIKPIADLFNDETGADLA